MIVSLCADLVLAVLLDVLAVHVDMILDHSVMASLLVGQRYVPIVLVGFSLDRPFEQPFEGTHPAAGLDCSPNSTYCPGNCGSPGTCQRVGHSMQDSLEWMSNSNAEQVYLPVAAA